MTDRIIVSRKALEMAHGMVSEDSPVMKYDGADYLREIIDTAEEAKQVTRKEAIEQAFRTLSEMPSEEFRAALAAIPPEKAKVFEPFLGQSESAWITDRPPTVEEVGDREPCVVRFGDYDEVRNGSTARSGCKRGLYSRWCRLPPYAPPVKRLCWCGAEMSTKEVCGKWWISCSHGSDAHGSGPVTRTESEAWAAYDKMVGR